MNQTTTPAPRRAGTTATKEAAQARLRDALSLIANDEEALKAVLVVVTKLAKRSRVRRR